MGGTEQVLNTCTEINPVITELPMGVHAVPEVAGTEQAPNT
jgi:hypothetical protein